MRSRDDVAAMVASDAHQGLIGRGCCHFLGPAVVTVTGDDAVAVCESLLVTHRDGKFAVRRAGANHFRLRRIDRRWQIVSRTTRALDGRSRVPGTARGGGGGSMSGSLSGKVALVTGAGAGIGEGIARRFADEGARVVVAEFDEESGRAVAESVGGVFVATDVCRSGAGRKRHRDSCFRLRCDRRPGQQRLGWRRDRASGEQDRRTTGPRRRRRLLRTVLGDEGGVPAHDGQRRGPGDQHVQPQRCQRAHGVTRVQRRQGGVARTHPDRRT